MSVFKVFISQPMSGISEHEYEEMFNEARYIVLNHFRDYYDEIEFITTYHDFDDMDFSNIKHPKIFILANALEKMSEADCIVFVGKWYEKRGCLLERCVAKLYKLDSYIIQYDGTLNKAGQENSYYMDSTPKIKVHGYSNGIVFSKTY